MIDGQRLHLRRLTHNASLRPELETGPSQECVCGEARDGCVSPVLYTNNVIQWTITMITVRVMKMMILVMKVIVMITVMFIS